MIQLKIYIKFNKKNCHFYVLFVLIWQKSKFKLQINRTRITYNIYYIKMTKIRALSLVCIHCTMILSHVLLINLMRLKLKLFMSLINFKCIIKLDHNLPVFFAMKIYGISFPSPEVQVKVRYLLQHTVSCVTYIISCSRRPRNETESEKSFTFIIC